MIEMFLVGLVGLYLVIHLIGFLSAVFLLPKEIPVKERIAAAWNWTKVAFFYIPPMLATYIIIPFVIWTGKRSTNDFGESEQEHTDRYKAEGSSGKWYYVATDVKFLDPWNNWEDGLLGEPSGKHSARENGKEDTFMAKYRWSIRNPFNKGKRTNRNFACYVNDCDIEWSGQENISDKTNDLSSKGWQFVKATDRTNGKVYYGYRSVKLLDDEHVRQFRLGFKIKPGHAGTIQDSDDLDKAYTLRLQFKSSIN